MQRRIPKLKNVNKEFEANVVTLARQAVFQQDKLDPLGNEKEREGENKGKGA
jgi:hypothetical protein